VANDGEDMRDEFVANALAKLETHGASDAYLHSLRQRVEEDLQRRPYTRGRQVPARLAAFITCGLLCGAVGAFIGASVSNAQSSRIAPASGAATPVLAFLPSANWNTMETAIDTPALPNNNQVAWAANVPFAPEDSMTGWPTNTTKTLPADGIVVFASLARYKTIDPSIYPDQNLPLSLSDGRFHSSGYETQPAPNVSSDVIYAHVKSQYLLVIVWYGSNTPTHAMTTSAQDELNRLNVPAPPAPS
jgi:hypothetical protein